MRLKMLGCALLGGALWLGILPAQAQTPAQITPAMMEQFNRLPPAQQEVLASQYGIDLKQLRSGQTSRDSSLETTPTLMPRTVDSTKASQRSALEKSPADQETELEPFGYNVFAGQPTSQTPLADIPVPDDYVVGPGDELRIQLYGKENATHVLKVSREGDIDFPTLGPINVAGLTFQQVQEDLQAQVSEKMIGVDASISFGALRTMQIFVMGDAFQPGAYNVNALTTVTQALQVAGGIDTVGSLRKVQVKRGGRVVRNVDLYKMLIWGDTSDDIRLSPGDTVFIPAKGSEVSIKGLVKRPAIYELAGSAPLSRVLAMAGGMKAEAIREITVIRRSEAGTKVFNLNMNSGRDQDFSVRDGDEIEVRPTTTEFSQAIAIRGAVVREGNYQYAPNIRVSQLIKDSHRDLKATADLDYALVVREINARHDIEVLQFNLGRAITRPGSADDLALQPRDQVLVFNREAKDLFIREPQDKKAKQDQTSQAQQMLDEENVDAAIQAKNQQQSQISRKVVESQTGAVVTQKQLSEGERLTLTEIAKSNGATALVSDSRQALLAPIIERLKAQSSPANPAQLAEVRGEVKFPGLYPLTRAATLNDLLIAAGGLKEQAYVAELSRLGDENGRLRIQHQRLQLDALTRAQGSPRAQSKDSLNVLANPDWREEATVQVFGEVKYPGTYTVRRGETIGSLVVRAGGLTEYAYPKGTVFAREALRKQEQERLVYVKEQLRQEISTLALRRQNSIAGYSTSPTEAIGLVDKLENTQAIGRMSINMPAILEGDIQSDVMLQNGDKLYIPELQNVVSIVGQVQLPSSHVYDPSLSIEDYLNLAGGTKKQADTDRIYVIKADGSVMLPSSNYWFSRKSRSLEPGDTVVAPIDSDYIDNLSAWTSATQLLYQLGVAWSAIK